MSPSAPITPTSESALEIGCFCSTRLMAQPTVNAANSRNKMTSSILGEGHQQSGYEQVGDRDGEHKGPRKAHQLVIAESRHRPANPDVQEQNHADLGREPEQRQENRRDD